MSKIAVIDIGSNSVRMVIFDALARAPHYVFNEKAMCRLGEGLNETGRLSPDGVISAKSELERFIFIARAMGVARMDFIATAAVREAEDGAAFCDWVKAELGQNVRVLAGEEEAQLSAQGVLLGWPQADGLISDMGGSSMELIEVKDGVVGRGFSTRLGPLRLTNMDKAARKRAIDEELDRGIEMTTSKAKRLYLVGGSWRAFAKVDMERKGYPFPILHEYVMSHDDVKNTLDFINTSEISALHDLTKTSTARLELLPMASKVLAKLVSKLQVEEIAISSYGLREGLLYENMPEDMRESDPLLAAALQMEQEFARVPGYGAVLFAWLKPLYGEFGDVDLRILEAACWLHDTNWRFHPDFRSRIGFELVAQANICGVTHKERVFLALALAARYENNPVYAELHPATELLDQSQKEAAWFLGRAMRLGAMLSGSVPELLENVHLERRQDLLVLKIDSQYRALYGESVLKRLASLGKLRNSDVRVEFN